MLFIIRFLFGYVVFTAKGSFPERFMNLTARYGISLWDIKKDDETFSASCMASEYKTLRKIVKKSFMKIKIKEKKGLPFILRKYRKRKGILVGMLSFFLIIYVLSLHIFTININGNIDISEDEIKQTLSELGVVPGILSINVDSSLIENSIMSKFNNISWTSANVIGSHLDIEISEKISPPDIVDEKPCNIVAACDGFVTRVEIYSGKREVNVGDAVVKGQLLVNGIVEDEFGNNSLPGANAKIFARTKRVIIEEVPIQDFENVRTGKVKKIRKLKILAIELPLSVGKCSKENYEQEVSTNTLKIFGKELPISIYKENWYQYKNEKVKKDKSQVIDLAEKKVVEQENKFDNVRIISKEKNGKWVDNKYLLKVTYDCEEDIAQKDLIKTE